MSELDPRYFKGLHYRRIHYRPGLGICQCNACAGLYNFSQRAGARFTLRLGAPNPNCEYLNRERVFAEQWAKEHGYSDLAQDLVRRPKRPGEKRDHLWNRGPVAWILNYRDRVILATIIQWLGTNVGWCFLEQCVRRCGFDLVRRAEKEAEILEPAPEPVTPAGRERT